MMIQTRYVIARSVDSADSVAATRRMLQQISSREIELKTAIGEDKCRVQAAHMQLGPRFSKAQQIRKAIAGTCWMAEIIWAYTVDLVTHVIRAECELAHQHSEEEDVELVVNAGSGRRFEVCEYVLGRLLLLCKKSERT
jgi:hypothetical protein